MTEPVTETTSTGEPPMTASPTEGSTVVEPAGDSGPGGQLQVISTYRYLRLAIVTVVLALLVSLILERAHATCWNGSISAYYYTPVHSIFIAALAVIGVSLIAIRGGTAAEEMLLNGAGFLAPVVAFVPTGWSPLDCPSNLTSTTKPIVDQLVNGNHFFAAFSSNNLVSFIAGGLLAIIISVTIAKIRGNQNRLLVWELVVPAIGSAVVVCVGFAWHEAWPASFSTHAHAYSAMLMFSLVAVVIILTARRERSHMYKALYFGCAGVMGAGGFLVGLVGLLVGTWTHEVLVLEAVEISGFLVFWFLQTIELWDGEPSTTTSSIGVSTAGS